MVWVVGCRSGTVLRRSRLMAKNFWVLALAAGVIAGCGDAKSDSSAATVAAQPANAPAPAALAAATSGAESFTASGPLIVEHQVEITAQREGVVAKIFIEAGQRVKAGTLLAQLDDRQVNANL